MIEGSGCRVAFSGSSVTGGAPTLNFVHHDSVMTFKAQSKIYLDPKCGCSLDIIIMFAKP